MPLKLTSVIFGHSFTRIQTVARCFCSNSVTFEQVRQLIRTHTEVTSDHMTPEIQLHLITPKCALWHSRGEDAPFTDPFWAFYWPGGQVLSRFVLDNPRLFTDKRVLDIGSGCGASAIASKMSGAHTVCANDIDHVAIEAIKMNCDLNRVCVDTSSDDIIGSNLRGWDIVFLGDMFYDENFTDRFSVWLPQLSQGGIEVLVGDPGRLPLVSHPLRRNLVSLYQCPLPENCLKENSGMSTGTVWKFKC
ncbi:electron transfer flavoprotein beta subunit lysine methyltransferase-like isoform X1 [Saccostrea cucullata]|uniref:electron transfer flavoprotein beta subunit lysine methyltransferase-like isoform X1 n=1 Tax=Saccostrea cuccullata TaxID=36930 RepID=UPI002ED0EC80